MILTYFLPIGLMSFTYARVGIELWGSQSIGECTQRQLENIKSKRRVGTVQINILGGFGGGFGFRDDKKIILNFVLRSGFSPHIEVEGYGHGI